MIGDEGKGITRCVIWGISSIGRASALQADGCGFESHVLHLITIKMALIERGVKSLIIVTM